MPSRGHPIRRSRSTATTRSVADSAVKRPTGIVLDAPRRALQQFMLKQRDAGMLLTMVSKNNEPDVLEAFERNPEMPLQRRHFTAWRIDWESKADNLARL